MPCVADRSGPTKVATCAFLCLMRYPVERYLMSIESACGPSGCKVGLLHSANWAAVWIFGFGDERAAGRSAYLTWSVVPPVGVVAVTRPLTKLVNSTFQKPPC